VKQIYTGWFDHVPRRVWSRMAAALLDEGKNDFRFVLPTQRMIDQVRYEIASAGTGRTLSGQVGTFDDMVREILAASGQSFRMADSVTRDRLLERAIGETIPGGPEVLRSRGFRETVLAALADWKRSVPGARSFGSWMENIRTNVFERFGSHARQLFEAVERYQALLVQHRLLDREDSYRMAVELVDAYRVPAVLFVDQFTITAFQEPLFLALARRAEKVYAFVPFAPEEWEETPHLKRRTLRFLARAAHEFGFSVVPLAGLTTREREERLLRDTGHFESYVSMAGGHALPLLFCTGGDGSAQDEDIVALPRTILIPAASLEQEIRHVAKEIRHLTLEKHVPLHDIAVVVADAYHYLPVIGRIFEEYGVPFDGVARLPLPVIPLAQSLHAVMDRLLDRNVPDPADTVVVSFYWGNPDTLREALAQWYGGRAVNPGEAVLPVREWLSFLEFLLASAGAPGRWYRMAADPEIPYTVDDLTRDMNALARIAEISRAVVSAHELSRPGHPTDLRDFWEEVRREMNHALVEIPKRRHGGVRLLSPVECCGEQWGTVFFIGLNEGVTPRRAARSWMGDILDTMLRASGNVSYADERREEDYLHFLGVCRSARSRLYLSYLSPEVDERHHVSPLFARWIAGCGAVQLERLPRLTPALALVPRPMDRQRAQDSSKEWNLHVAYQLRHVGTEWLEQEGKRGGFRWKKVCRALLVQRMRSSGARTLWDGVITDPVVKDVIRLQFATEKTWNVSEINDFAVCPYKYYAGRVLKLRPEVEDESLRANGVFLHRVLQKVFDRYRRHRSLEALPEALGAAFRETEEEMPELFRGPLGEAEKQRLHAQLARWLAKETESLKQQGNTYPLHVEWPFDSLPLSFGEITYRVTGRVDRVDLDEGQNRLIVYDYKTSVNKYRGIKDVEEGTHVQLALYLMAAGELAREQGLEVIGGSFYGLGSDPKKVGLWQKADGITAYGARRIDAVDDLQEVLNEAGNRMAVYLSMIGDGSFEAVPRKECDAHCPYLAVCRFDSANLEKRRAVTAYRRAKEKACLPRERGEVRNAGGSDSAGE
jgi:RecB family exonuclease